MRLSAHAIAPHGGDKLVPFPGLKSKRMNTILHTCLSDYQQALWSSYLVNIEKGPTRVRAMIMFDLQGFLDLGVRDRSSDIKAVLQVVSARYPDAMCPPSHQPDDLRLGEETGAGIGWVA